MDLFHARFKVKTLLGLKEEPYPGRVLISFWCDYDNKNFFYVLGF